MTRSEFKNVILSKFNYYGFVVIDGGKESEWAGVRNTSFTILKRDITIRTQGETVIYNGQMMQQPGKIGDITLKVLISSGVGELNDCNEIVIPLFGVHMQAIFKDVIFKEYHEMIRMDDISKVDDIIRGFLNTFGQ